MKKVKKKTYKSDLPLKFFNFQKRLETRKWTWRLECVGYVKRLSSKLERYFLIVNVRTLELRPRWLPGVYDISSGHYKMFDRTMRTNLARLFWLCRGVKWILVRILRRTLWVATCFLETLRINLTSNTVHYMAF